MERHGALTFNLWSNAMKNLEKSLRRKADAYGLRLVKSRRRDVTAIDYGRYALIDVRTGGTVHPILANYFVHSLSLEEVQDYLSS